MRQRYDRVRRDGVAAIIVIGGHVLLIVLWSRMLVDVTGGNRNDLSTQLPDSAVPARRTQLLLLPEPERIAGARGVTPEPLLTRSFDPSSIAHALPLATDPSDEASLPLVDWHGEGERAARETVDAAIHPPGRSFDPPAASASAGKAPKSFEWSPEPKRFGISGLIPYVRLGRCFLGLGFVGCRFGDPPQPNGQLFEHMRDPDRPTSSVPDNPH